VPKKAKSVAPHVATAGDVQVRVLDAGLTHNVKHGNEQPDRNWNSRRKSIYIVATTQ